MGDTAVMTPSAPTRGRRPMSDRRRWLQRLEISRAAIRLFAEQGVTETTGEQIAEAVGLSARTLWRYFRSKESCVEPVLSLTTDAFVETLRRWPTGTALEEHLVADHRPPEQDGEASLAVVAMSRHEPALRAIWLVVYERAEAVLAEVVAERLGREPDELAVRVQAATLAAALRITTEDIAADCADGRTRPREEGLARLSEAVRSATHGVVGDVPA
ncbi:TetR/AcrR family transcriptional regulator [Actinomycetospora termitidis]|uniref:TetR family transcriptional regulator n=1 Tax=Actinomycetospora termitidis TaxID=3053470 RepID=A0ABT7MJ22_9PSEU|nr:TetR/AcrR family transcriptional regulator [Actinomycetospora sp. Odt1-22]MDL5159917.1 TetR family transcriptional regulator [Actinomycetospora sp. Odt1-22]